MRRHIRYLGMVYALATLAGCPAASPAKPEGEEAVPEVKAVTAETTTLHDRLPVAGVLEPLPGKDVKLGALVPGRLVRVRVAEGDRVRQGDVLAELESTALADAVRRAEAEERKARAVTDVAHLREKRDAELLAVGAASRQQAEESRAGAAAGEATIADAQANLSAARTQLERATLRSPIDGVIAAVYAHAGEPQDGSGKPIVEVADPSLLELRAAVPSARAARVQRGQKVTLKVEGTVDAAGVVFALAPMVDAATGSVTLRVRVNNLDGKLRGGSAARGEVVVGDVNGVAIPVRALVPGAEGASSESVVILDGEAAHVRAVTVSVRDGDRAGVEGVKAGERVIVEGAYGLADGAKVRAAQ